MESFKKAILQVADFIQNLKGDKIIICLTGDFSCGKTSIGNFLEKIDEDIVFLNSDYFRTNIYNKTLDNDLDTFLSSYDYDLLEQELYLFKKGKNFGIFIKNKDQIVKKIFLNNKAKILLFEFPFILAKKNILHYDFVIKIKSTEKRRKSLNSKTSVWANKAMDVYKERFDKIYKPNLVVLN